jgi:hypothetical protein
MNDFIPSATFVNKTMDAIWSYETRKTQPAKVLMNGIIITLLQMGALLAGCGIAFANVLRLYYAVFAPVVSH